MIGGIVVILEPPPMPRAFPAFDPSELQLAALLRRAIAGRGLIGVDPGLAEALACFLGAVNRGARRRLYCAAPGAVHLTGDERALLNLVSAAQDSLEAQETAAAIWLVAGSAAPEAIRAARALADALAASGVRLPPLAAPRRPSDEPTSEPLRSAWLS